MPWIHWRSVSSCWPYKGPLHSTSCYQERLIDHSNSYYLWLQLPSIKGPTKFEWLPTHWWSTAKRSLPYHFAIQMPSYWNLHWQRMHSSISGYMRMTEIGPDFYGWLIKWTQKVSFKLIDLMLYCLLLCAHLLCWMPLYTTICLSIDPV